MENHLRWSSSMILQMRKLQKIENSIALHQPLFDSFCVSAFKVKLTPKVALSIRSPIWPPIFPLPGQRGFRGMDATVHAIFRQFLPTVDLSYIEEFLLLGYLDPCVFTSCLRSRSQPKNCGVRTVSISTGEMALCQFLLLLFLVVLPLFRTFDTSTRRNERKTKKVCCGIVNFSCHIRLIGFVCVFVDCWI